MPEVLKLRGGAAFSVTRLARLTQNVQAVLPRLKALAAEHWYFVELKAPLAPADLERLTDLLGAHPAGNVPSGTLKLVTPRLGTISPRSSKATEIARQCGFAAVTRIERGTAASASSEDTITTGTVSSASVSAAHRIPPVP